MESQTMKIEHIKLENFRKFAVLETDFHPSLTVLVGVNGQGKTSLLDAMAVNLSSFIGAFDGIAAEGFRQNDIRKIHNPETESTVMAGTLAVSTRFLIGKNQRISALRELKPKSGGRARTTTKGSREWAAHGESLMESLRSPAQTQTALPVIAYYDTSRLWSEHRDMERKAEIDSRRESGYEDCLSGKSNYKQLRHWMILISQEADKSRSAPDPILQKRAALYDTFLHGISQTVDQLLGSVGYTNLRYRSGDTLEIRDDAAQIYLPVDSLSDGIRAVVTLAADIAFRCVKLNPQMGKDAPQQTEGIVLIDEVDMHLHPNWQQTILSQLCTAFPRIQFIVSTHSPQVLSTVSAESIRIIRESGEIETPAEQSKGAPSNEILARILGVNPTPDLAIVRDLNHYRALIENGEYESTAAQQLKNHLLAHFGEQHFIWRDCERLIRLQESKRRLAALKGNSRA